MEIEPFLRGKEPLYDVRSPAEFSHGTMGGAINLPLFSDFERSQVGTLYKQSGYEAAFLLGLEKVGPKMRSFVETALKEGKEARLFCWRGGMRSQSMGWLLSKAGIKVSVLSGGYKVYRNWVLDFIQRDWKFQVLGGFTGSGKTEKLYTLKVQGEQILDLEALAHHRGSAFGALRQKNQPSQEAFENRIADALFKMDPAFPIWVEDESRMIGSCKIPDPLFTKMKIAPFTCLKVSYEERLNRILREYGSSSRDELILSVQKIAKRLGSERSEKICSHIQEGHLEEGAKLLLEYYDRTYSHSIKGREKG